MKTAFTFLGLFVLFLAVVVLTEKPETAHDRNPAAVIPGNARVTTDVLIENIGTESGLERWTDSKNNVTCYVRVGAGLYCVKM
jgi:hypothetical protein